MRQDSEMHYVVITLAILGVVALYVNFGMPS